MGRVIPKIRKDLRRHQRLLSLSSDVAHDPLHSHDRPTSAPFRTQTLAHLTVSRRLGNEVLAPALSVATYRGWER